MTIKELEERLSKYIIEIIDVDNFQNIKKYLNGGNNPLLRITPVGITESFIENEEFFRAYVVDESKIGTFVKEYESSGFKEMIIFIGSADGVNVLNTYCVDTNRVEIDVIRNFLKELDLLDFKNGHLTDIEREAKRANKKDLL